ncbi:phospholipase A2 inhibitor NAI-like [Eublepharis macularius]|uniref:Phospholipase A2 inhibitor NAI-like n=1 Tax=Eublepharis macularius TaxID=481883 RepID=A0AA97KHP2_EUBMA|nr:phospholipase A2 inhibitor NAI-like [Eublepharis macularius]
MKAVLSICFLWGLFSQGALLECYTCVGEECKTPKIQNCTAEQDACYVAIAEVILGSSIVPRQHVMVKQCDKVRTCWDKQLSLSTVKGGSYRANIKCCYTDLCNNMNVSLPETVESPPNGIHCPSCFAFDSTVCTEVENLTCTGNETKCVQGAIKISTDPAEEGVPIIFQGCATPTACQFPVPLPGISSEHMHLTGEQLQCIKGYEDLTV